MQNDLRRRFLQERFSPESWLGLHLTIGVIVVFVSMWAFAEIAAHLGAAEPLALLDQRIVGWFHRHATPQFTNVALAVSFCGSVRFLVGATLVAAALLFRRQLWNRLLVLLLSMLGGSALNIALKHAFHRQRPILENPLVTLSSYGFPSGHTMGATVFYGFVALIAARMVKSRAHQALVIAAGLVAIVLIGISRIYLGAHYPTDVLGAFAAGTAWLTFCWTGLETIRRRKAHRRKVDNVYV